jgi:hypothetical protein
MEMLGDIQSFVCTIDSLFFCFQAQSCLRELLTRVVKLFSIAENDSSLSSISDASEGAATGVQPADFASVTNVNSSSTYKGTDSSSSFLWSVCMYGWRAIGSLAEDEELLEVVMNAGGFGMILADLNFLTARNWVLRKRCGCSGV